VAASALRVGDPETLGGYRIERRLGEGGQGVVYLGVSPSGEKVAIKVVRFPLVSGDVAAFGREIAAARQVAEFCTASVLDAALDHDPPYIVSEYVEGPTLQRVIQTEGVRTGAALQRLAVATITALAAIHRAGVVHRDFKPGNVLLAPDGPRVIDFGIARILDATTTTGATTGSPPYMAPEHFTGARVGPEADIFAWGSTMVFAATGKPPFGDDSFAAVAYRILHAEPELSALPDPLREVVRRCLAKEPAQRPTAHEVLLRLLNRGDSSPVEALEHGRAVARGAEAPPPLADGPWTEPAPSRRRVLARAGAVAAALAASGTVLGYRLWADPAPRAGPASGGTARADAAPATPLALAGAIDAALGPTPCADFESVGVVTPGDWRVRAEGRIVHNGLAQYADADHDMVVRRPGAESERIMIVHRAVHAVARRNAGVALMPDDRPQPGYASVARMVAVFSSVQTIVRLILATLHLQRNGLTYEGSAVAALIDSDLNGELFDRLIEQEPLKSLVERSSQARFTDWFLGVSYTLTIDEHALPTSFRASWRVPPVDAPIAAVDFTTRYHRWRAAEEIRPPR